MLDPIFQSELTIFTDRTLSPSSDISICLWFHKILWVLLPIPCVIYCPSCWVCYCPYCGSVTAHSVRQLLSILCVSYCPFCGVCYYPSCGSVTDHSVCLLLPILRGLLLPILPGLLLSILRVYYCLYWGSVTAHSVSVTVDSVCLLLPILRGLLLSILVGSVTIHPCGICYCLSCWSVTTHSVCQCQFCVPHIAHSAGSVTIHPAGLLLSILQAYYYPFCVSYCPFFGSVTAHAADVTVHYAGLLLPILFGHAVPIPVTLVPRITRTSTNGLPLGLNIHNTADCAPESVRLPQNGAHRPSHCYELFADFCIRCIY